MDWYDESTVGSTIYARRYKGEYALRVAIEIKHDNLLITTVDSRNITDQGYTMESQANLWVEDLARNIRLALNNANFEAAQLK